MIEDAITGSAAPGSIIVTREAVCIATCDNKGVWITHTDLALWPKAPALGASASVRLFCVDRVADSVAPLVSSKTRHFPGDYLCYDFYNGAMSTAQCRRLAQALDTEQPEHRQLTAVVLMGGRSYFNNGIHLNVIEAAADPALESWYNVNAMNDVVESILLDFPSRGIVTVAAARGNRAAGGVALATARDVVLASQSVVLNPAYRALGLHESEFHRLSYPARYAWTGPPLLCEA
ncbi:Hydrogenase maturation factor HoxX [Tolypocladium ophioglossoides CBS 100239]|uniref:Hydrogenase maturation factor HoxX n=1 Tax=Tolypocladium ophioglossoides (strain CBS 100239) TaxID=1163406 RepID=A0A0L0N2L3_TOLOC|nr:Hydrogenase maturation factor HoxX [Tolypocladium ophioglossoides CBS 100239]